MENKELEEQLEKLKQFEKDISGFDNDEDSNFINELETMLSFLKGETKSETLKVKIKKLSDNAVIPLYARHGDAGMDLVATSIISNEPNQITYGTGIAIEIPEGFVGLIFPRSSIRKYGLTLSNSVGVIDSGYRGEICATFYKPNSGYAGFYQVGDKIAQIIILPYPKIEFVESENLSDTERGDGGFGSTGK